VRGLTTVPDLEQASAQEVVKYALDRFHPQIALACSFQKEESVLVHMLREAEPTARVFTIDTGVLFPETLETWKRFEDRFGVAVEVADATSPDGVAWTKENCCGTRKVDALNQALTGLDAWMTGVRREQSPTRATAKKIELDEGRGIVKINPIADWTDRDVWAYLHEHDLPYNPLHDQGYESIGCAPCTLPGSGRDGRWAGEDKTECGLHVAEPTGQNRAPLA
jgi:phosphoadenosine phosphosulfate reductase